MAQKGQISSTETTAYSADAASSQLHEEDLNITLLNSHGQDFHCILQHAQNQNNAFRRLRLDICCLSTALKLIRRMEYAFQPESLRVSMAKTQLLIVKCNEVFASHYHKSKTGPITQHGTLFPDALQAVEELDEFLPTFLNKVILHHAEEPQYKFKLQYPLVYPGDIRVCRRGNGFDDSRYDVLLDGELEPRTKNSPQQWRSRRDVYEHIDIMCSGRRVYDPFFFQEDGKQFFTPGRVFTVLWDASTEDSADPEFYDEDPTVEEERKWMGGFEGVYTGPYIGPTTCRSFLVFEQGQKSCQCLPISTLASQGTRYQPDQHNYGMIYSGNDGCTPMSLSDEDNIIYPTLYVPAVPAREWPQPILKGQGPPDPPYDRLPTHDLLENSRVDYRRICIVDFGVRVRNVGILDEASLCWLMEWAKEG